MGSPPRSTLAVSAAAVCAVPSSHTACGSLVGVVRLAVEKVRPLTVWLPVRLELVEDAVSVV
jgi:hypothetical protein